MNRRRKLSREFSVAARVHHFGEKERERERERERGYEPQKDVENVCLREKNGT